ncbi:hypothetical protein HYD71_00860 [Mycoplasmopsis bovis]|nr:hypothetical protein HYD71_00860 [Mycoplasmopsis bovis]
MPNIKICFSKPMYFVTHASCLQTIALKYKEITLDKQFKDISLYLKAKNINS